MGTFDVSRLPRRALLEQAFPGQKLPESGWGKVSCRLPGCQHANGDRSPSLSINVEQGGFECLTNGATGRGWRDFVTAFWGQERWNELLRDCMPPPAPKTREERVQALRSQWQTLRPERAWTERYQLQPELSARYLRSGARYPGDPVSESVVGYWRAGELVGAKWRLPPGARWQVGQVARSSPTAKYTFTAGSDREAVLLEHEALARPRAVLLVCAGEKDALVAASHLGPAWAPVSGCLGEGKVPRRLLAIAQGRRVVVAYDGDAAGREGAARLAVQLRGVATSCLRADLPQDVPPGKDRPGWDLAELWEHRGAGALEALVNGAVEFEPAELERAARQVAPAPSPGDSPPTPPPADPDAGAEPVDDGPGWTDDLDAWGELEGATVEWLPGRGKSRRRRPQVRYRGLVRLTSCTEVHAEDPEEPDGWARSEEVVYRFQLEDRPEPVERHAQGGPRAFAQLLEGSTDLGRHNDCASARERLRLWRWAARRLPGQERRERRLAQGYHGELGWLSPGGLRVRGGQIEPCPFEIAPPETDEPEFSRYRLAHESDAEVAEVGRWVLDRLLRCDHAEGAYTLPLLGAFMAAPLWAYVPSLDRWQRYAFFGQGTSGVGKTQLARYLWSFWGDFTELHGMTTWATTATAIESLLHHASFAPVFTQDWKRSLLKGAKLNESMRLLQSYADRSSRGRSAQGGAAMQTRRPPRATWVIDGEDLPEGEQSTLGRLVVLTFDQHGSGLVADADDEHLRLGMVRRLPALTSRWIAYVQRNAAPLEALLHETRRELDRQLPPAANRARLVRNYAVQVATVDAWLEFMRGVVGRERDSQLGAYSTRSWEVHRAMAEQQLAAVEGESAGELFWSGLCGLLKAGVLALAPEGGSQHGQNPFNGHGAGVTVGEFSWNEEKAWIWPSVALPHLQGHLSRGGGDRIEFSRKAILQQLRAAGLVLDQPRRRDDGRRKVTTWEVPIAALDPTWTPSGEGQA